MVSGNPVLFDSVSFVLPMKGNSQQRAVNPTDGRVKLAIVVAAQLLQKDRQADRLPVVVAVSSQR